MTRSRIVISPLPSMFGGRFSSVTTWSLVQLKLGGVFDRDDPLVRPG